MSRDYQGRVLTPDPPLRGYDHDYQGRVLTLDPPMRGGHGLTSQWTRPRSEYQVVDRVQSSKITADRGGLIEETRLVKQNGVGLESERTWGDEDCGVRHHQKLRILDEEQVERTRPALKQRAAVIKTNLTQTNRARLLDEETYEHQTRTPLKQTTTVTQTNLTQTNRARLLDEETYKHQTRTPLQQTTAVTQTSLTQTNRGRLLDEETDEHQTRTPLKQTTAVIQTNLTQTNKVQANYGKSVTAFVFTVINAWTSLKFYLYVYFWIVICSELTQIL